MSSILLSYNLKGFPIPAHSAHFTPPPGMHLPQLSICASIPFKVLRPPPRSLCNFVLSLLYISPLFCIIIIFVTNTHTLYEYISSNSENSAFLKRSLDGATCRVKRTLAVGGPFWRKQSPLWTETACRGIREVKGVRTIRRLVSPLAYVLLACQQNSLGQYQNTCDL